MYSVLLLWVFPQSASVRDQPDKLLIDKDLAGGNGKNDRDIPNWCEITQNLLEVKCGLDRVSPGTRTTNSTTTKIESQIPDQHQR